MADTSQNWKAQQTAVLDLDDMAGSDHSDYETNFSDSKGNGGSGKSPGGNYMDSMKQRLQENVTSMMWQSGKERATKVWNIYGNLDILRPYFNVEQHEVRSRLLYSFIPQRPTEERQRVPRELYGPLMIIFTLIALLLFQMKTAEHRVEEGTLMGTAFGVCFTYWFGASGVVWVLSYVCNTHMTLIQILSMMGYGMGSHCVVIFLGTIIHTSHDHLFFYALWAVIGGLSTLRMLSIILSRTHGQSQRLIVCGAVAALNLLFMIYLHFAYHQIVEDLSELIMSNEKPAHMQQLLTEAVVKDGQEPVEAADTDPSKSIKETLRPMADSVMKMVNNTVDGAAKQFANQNTPNLNVPANQEGPLLKALKEKESAKSGGTLEGLTLTGVQQSETPRFSAGLLTFTVGQSDRLLHFEHYNHSLKTVWQVLPGDHISLYK